MPRLVRLRFVAVGHPNARMEDLTLDFRDPEGHPTDSTIWLRNGGGKSSILNLFFATVRTGKRDFLGGRAESRQRKLDDYVMSNDRGAVVAEWELDVAADTLEFARDPGRYLTGVFYEKRPGGEGLKRLFFCSRVAEDVPESTMAGLPLHIQNEDGKLARRTMASFKQTWNALRDQVPHLNPFCTDTQSEWRVQLEDAGLDPGLFAYQLRMNLREGGADELFRFRSDEQFVDFLLELTVDGTRGDEVGRNIGVYRKQLRRRKHELLPDRDLCNGLIERLGPVAEVAKQRQKMTSDIEQAARRVTSLEAGVNARIAGLERDAEACTVLEATHQKDAERLDGEARQASALASALRLVAIRRRSEVLASALGVAQDEEQAARKTLSIWKAAVPMRRLTVHEGEAVAYRAQIENRRSEAAPILEELKGAAALYAAALKHQTTDLRARQATLRTEIDGLNDKSRDSERSATDLARQTATADARLYALESSLSKVDTLRQRLQDADLMLSDETGEDATTRVEAEIATIDGDIEKTRTARDQAQAEHDALSSRLQTDHRQIASLEARIDQLAQQLKRGERERDTLEQDPALLRALEVEHVDLDDLSDDVPTILHRQSTEQLERVARLRAERAGMERARLHLQQHGLLPPQPGVERMLELLVGRVAATSGWHYVAEHISSEGSARLDAVHLAPEVAQGVVVAATDFDRAIALLEDASFESDEPIVLATPECLQDASTGRRQVVGPRSHAFFDRSAGREALESIEERCDRIESEIGQAEGAAESLASLVHRLRHFRSRYPRGWFSEQATQLKDARAALDSGARALDGLQNTLKSTAKARRDLDRKLETLGEVKTRAVSGLQRLQHFVEESESQASAWREEFDGLMTQRDTLKEAAVALRETSDEDRRKAGQLAETLEPLVEESGRLEARLAQIGYLDEAVEAAAGPVVELRMRYERLVNQYEGEIGNDELLRLAEHHEEASRQSAEEVARFTRDSGVTREAIAEALAGLDNPDAVERTREAAEEAMQEARDRLFELEYEVRHLRNGLKDAERHWIGQGKPSLRDIDVQDPAQAESQATEAESNATTRLEEATHLRRKARESERTAADLRHQAQALRKDFERLNSVRRSYAGLLPDIEVDESLSIADVDVVAELDALETSLSEIRTVMGQLDSARKQAVQAVRKWTTDTRFEHLKNEVAMRFRTLDADSLEREVDGFRESLTLRSREIERTLEDINRHRVLLTKLVLSIAEDGLRQLKLADRASRVPLEVPEIGGAQFLRITTREPAAPAARLDLIGQLIDELIDSDTFPTGIPLVQRAVRQLARPFRVRVLNPDPGSPQRYIPITDTARFSGGEQLTCAILLYCTLANVRARAQGKARQPSSVLMLDNPIGRASRVRFLEMQREFARAMGIQLIYTTAVNDHDALGILPNVIRLRNERIDRRRGHRLVEHEAETVGVIESVRVSRREVSPTV